VNTPQRVAKAMWREDEASRALGMHLEEIGPGRARLSMTVRPEMANGQKLCHGGYIFMLADSAFGYACTATISAPLVRAPQSTTLPPPTWRTA
jgi:acyl-CoA thioesterase